MTDEIRRAGEARQILDAPVFQAAKASVEEQLANLRRTVPISSSEMHTRIILMEQLWGYLLGYFEMLAQTGQMEALRMEEERKRRSLLEQGVAMFRTTGRNSL